MAFNEAEERFLARQVRGHLATIGSNGGPQVKPVGFSYNKALGSIDIGGVNMGESAKFRNVKAHPKVAFVVDEVTGPGADGVHFMEIRGEAETATGPTDPTGHLANEIIRIRPRRVISFNIDPGHPGFRARDLPVRAHGQDDEVA